MKTILSSGLGSAIILAYLFMPSLMTMPTITITKSMIYLLFPMTITIAIASIAISHTVGRIIPIENKSQSIAPQRANLSKAA